MMLLAGLGNPGASYAGNRHNIGFMVLDAVQQQYGLAPWRRRFQGDAVQGEIDGHRLLLIKPLTYMNESGRAVSEAMQFYKIPLSHVIVFHDELDLDLGRIRVKCGGGDAGHNGLRSITAHCGADYQRVRIGIGHPGQKERVHGHVLSDFSTDECPVASRCIKVMAEHLPLLCAGHRDGFQTRVMQALSDPVQLP